MIRFSAEYIYYYARYLTGLDEEGTTLWAASRAQKCKGICKQDFWPHDRDVVISADLLKYAERDAFSRRSSFYQRCYNLNDLKYVLAIHKTQCAITFRMYESFKKADKYGVVQIPESNEKEVGLHSVCVIGYDDDLELVTDDGNVNKGFLKFVNSWGEEWGDQGYGYLPYKYFNKKYLTEALVQSLGHPERLYLYKYNIRHNNVIMTIKIGFSVGLTLTHTNIIFFDLFDNRNILVGWLISSKENQYAIELIDFFIWPDYRCNGYGKLLLEEYLNYERLKGHKNIYGWFSKDDNLSDGWYIVTKFFKENGFECTQDKTIFSWSTGQINIDI